MNHLPHLVQDLALIMVVAGITTLLFKRLKQPVVLGYILAGLIVGPKFPLFPTITEIENIKIWAEIGVIILLFTLGLEFSFKKLLHIGGPASITGLIEIFGMLCVGFVLGKLLDWPTMDCIFLGGILSIASTTIIIRAFDELGVKGKRFATLVFGVLIIEDLVAVVLMVILSTIAVSREFAGMEMAMSIIKLGFFLTLWFIAGIFFIPSLLNKVQKHLSDETMLVVSLGLCLLMVVLAAEAGFSPALGAFVMGSILAETLHAERIEHITKPIKDLFGAVFFVSVGMLIDPQILVDYALPILLITGVFVIAKVLSVTIGGVVSGQPLKNALHAGMSMGQIGEFSFIIATLGVTLNVTSSYLYPIAVAVSAITTFSTPYMIKAAGPLYKFIEKKLPERWRKYLTRYSTGAQTINRAGDWPKVIKSFLLAIVFTIVFSAGILLIFMEVEDWLMRSEFANEFIISAIAAGACLLTLSPFLWALIMKKYQPAAYANLWAHRHFHGPLIFLRLVRTLIALLIIVVVLLVFFRLYYALAIIAGLALITLLFSRKIHHYYLSLEEQFFYNFNRREQHEAQVHGKELAPWDAHITFYELPVGSPFMGKELDDLALREQVGVNVAMIKRGSYTIIAPTKHEKLYPGDRIYVIGTDEQLEQFKQRMQPVDMPDTSALHKKVALKKIVIPKGSELVGSTLHESKIRERSEGLIVGLERGGRRILNPGSENIIEAEDRIWIVGQRELILELRKEIE